MAEQVANTGSDRVIVEGAPAEVPAKGETKEEFVRRTAYEEVNKDMHKFKSRAKDAEAKAAEYEAKLKAVEEQQMKEQQRFQELYEREKKQREQEAVARKKDRDLYLRGLKLSQLKAELGNVRDEYLSHAAIDEIEVLENGTLSSESVRSVANKFRQEHPTLIPQGTAGNLTSYASPTSFNPSSGKTKSLAEMTFDEKSEILRRINKK